MKKCLLIMLIFLSCSFVRVCKADGEDIKKKEGATEQIEKGYDLPIDPAEKERAEKDCLKKMGLIQKVYPVSGKGAGNAVISDEDRAKMADVISQDGAAVLYGDSRLVPVRNYEKMESFLRKAERGETCDELLYKINTGGGIRREKYVFDGTDMYVLTCIGTWREDNEPGISGIYYTRLKEWEYTEKGWFCYQLCVLEPPEVTEIIDGSCLIRIRPLTEEQREMTQKCVSGLAYQGNNLLCSNWDDSHMEALDYNGLYEYLYKMKYQEDFNPENYQDGIPKEDFESLMMEYLPATSEQIQKYAVFDEEKQVYEWQRLGCMNYAPDFFGLSVPEVIDIKENSDGTVTLTVDAVCDMVICDDSVIRHELTVQFLEDGTFQYLSNRILDHGAKRIPKYQYRLGNQ